jgi:hypothetical protein
MHVQLSLVCEEASVRPDGRLDIRGVFNDLAAPGFPARQDKMVLVTSVEWDRTDEGRNKFRVDLIAPDGQTALTVDGETQVERQPADRPPSRTQLILPLEGVIFPSPGSYAFRVRVKGRNLRGPSLFLIQKETAEDSEPQDGVG